ncbi:MAG: single-stranded DNA-binding protein [Candidatus Atribacteria bacterium]|nr:single-stranded DNA-binding protein [Candidatus Atribacteria bacterium]MBE3093265.1 single-stranded DNA-binding protein [Chloroflexota bacterium]
MATFGDLNSFIGIGRLTRDPELRYTPGGKGVCKFGIAINRTYRNQDGNNIEEVLFINVTTWGKQAENVSQFLKKGRRVAISGELRSNNWQDKEGNKRTSFEINARTVQFLDLVKGAGAVEEGPAEREENIPDEPINEDTSIAEEDIPF